ncbi:hypothetical protein GB883_20065 [Georgenia thermotolerans]|uniref:Calcineurin-like phosphoesterase domain-containing protein n=1 Tax=Georgenia thermotolerans TaxID=527326 RepID=A0A7J5UJ22_9MICO|nr:hypothetical protein GB883_20065 [Georgenia thermotolerans]
MSRTFVGAGLALTAALAAAPASASPAQHTPAAHAAASPAQHASVGQDAFTFAVIGDVPYGAAARAAFPGQIQQMNEDDLRFVAHVGDIKDGSSECSDAYFAAVRSALDTFEHPLVYTPGDNEWVDCHRTNNGAYDPLERLATVREVFFPVPGKTLGATMPVRSQAALGLPENVAFRHNRVAFAVVNVQGSNNSLQPWTGRGLSEPTTAQLAEVEHRTAAVVEQLRTTFAEARQRHDRAVVVLTQADMFDPSQLAAAQADPAAVSGFRAIVAALAEEANRFDGPVYLVNGDSHAYAADAPLAAGSPWLGVYGTPAADDLRRVTVDGAANATGYLRFTVAPNAAGTDDVLEWEAVPFAS